ncbi:HdeD family acid-resistance protein [Nocardiopsis oceani]
MVRYAMTGGMLGELSRSWWLVVLRGGFVALLGLLAVLWVGMLPEGTLLMTLAVMFGIFTLVDGLALGWTASRSAKGTRTPMVVQAVLSVLLGVLAIAAPLAVGIAVVYVIGAWAVVTGIAEIVTAVRLRARISSEWLLIFVGALSIIFGLLLWFWPLAGAQAIALVVGIYAIVFGAVMAVAGFRLRGAADATARDGSAAAAGEEGPAGDEYADDESSTGEYAGYGHSAEGQAGGESGSGETDADREVSAFDEGYAGGYSDGYHGDPNAPESSQETGEDEPAGPRVGRHRAPKNRPDDHGAT